jgi:diguanylate cyclase (GGDEF)-like protein/PAS domain S-box-containing protein
LQQFGSRNNFCDFATDGKTVDSGGITRAGKGHGLRADGWSVFSTEQDSFASESRLPSAVAPRVLLVDDEPRMLESLDLLLKDQGFELCCASSGLAAIEHLNRSAFDLVILDLRMPDIGGHDLMDFINTQANRPCVIVVSGDIGIDAAIGALKRGAFDYLRKPYSRDELLNTVHNALRQRDLVKENRHIAAQLEQSEKKYRSLVDSSPDIIFTLDPQGRFTFINHRVNPLLGFNCDELVGQHYSALIHEDDAQRANYVFGQGLEHNRPSRSIELRLRTHHAGAEPRSFNTELIRVPFNESNQSNKQSLHSLENWGTYGVARDITERKLADELIAYQAYHDILTDLPNRVLFHDRLNLALLQAKRKGSEVALMFIDLDRFKLVNDTLGHGIGDVLLQHAAVRLRSCLRRGDTLARLGGDEFTAVLPDINNRQDAVLVAKKFLECLHQPFELANQSIHISASIGIAVYPADGESSDELISNSDIAMYHMKSQGKDGHSFFDRTMLDASSHKIEIEHSLRVALEQGELEMYYQPQVDIQSQKIIGAEALMRWNHPTRGFLGAGEFLPFSEENGLIIPISDWMLEAICADLLAWNETGATPLVLSLNLSPQYLDRGDFYDKLKEALSRHQIDPAQIEVEVTENICIRNPQTAIEQLNRLCQLGVSIAIDDFGTGYSSLSYLHRFPIHTLKIDRSFVTPIEDENGSFPVVLAIISIAKGLGLNLVAEGVETLVQARYLEKAGCNTIQGYLYHKPLPQKRLLELLREQVRSPAFSDLAPCQ